MNILENLCRNAKNASRTLKTASTNIKNNALLRIADNLEKNAKNILDENQKDIDTAVQNGMNKGRAMVNKREIWDESRYR